MYTSTENDLKVYHISYMKRRTPFIRIHDCCTRWTTIPAVFKNLKVSEILDEIWEDIDCEENQLTRNDIGLYTMDNYELMPDEVFSDYEIESNEIQVDFKDHIVV